MKAMILIAVSFFSTLSLASVVEGDGANSLMASLNYTGVRGVPYQNSDDSGVIYRVQGIECKRSNNSVFSPEEVFFMVPSYECTVVAGDTEIQAEKAEAQSLYNSLASFAQEDHVLGGKTYVGVKGLICNIDLPNTGEGRFACTYKDVNGSN